MKAYPEDLRKKILEALDRGMPKSEAARAFGVSRSSVKRYAAARREGRSLAPKKHPGPKPPSSTSEPGSSLGSRRGREARHHSRREVPLP
jgi:transposase